MKKPEIICECEIHPAASIFPLMEGDRFQSLVDSIQVHGLQNPIVCSGNVVLDGRNRLRAVEKLRNEGHEVELLAVEWDCGDRRMTPAEWITAQNLDRRHLSEDAYVAAQAALNRILRKEAKARQAATKLDGSKPGPGRGKKTVDTKTDPPFKRDTKAKNDRSTVGQVANKAGTSRHKAAQAVKLDQAVEAGVVPEEVQKDVIAGKTKLRDAVKQVPAKPRSAKAAKKKTRRVADVLDDLRLLLSELLACDRVPRKKIVDELTTWIERANNR